MYTNTSSQQQNYQAAYSQQPQQQQQQQQDVQMQKQQQQRSSFFRANRPSDLNINNHHNDYSTNSYYQSSQPSPYYQNYSPVPTSANSGYKTPSYTNQQTPKMSHTPTYSPMYNTSAHMIKTQQSYFNFDIPQSQSQQQQRIVQQQQQQQPTQTPHQSSYNQQNLFPQQQQQTSCFVQPANPPTPKYPIKSPIVVTTTQQNIFNFTPQSPPIVTQKYPSSQAYQVDLNNNHQTYATTPIIQSSLVETNYDDNEEIDVSAIDSTLDQNIDIDISNVDIASTAPSSTLSNNDYLIANSHTDCDLDHPLPVNTPPITTTTIQSQQIQPTNCIQDNKKILDLVIKSKQKSIMESSSLIRSKISDNANLNYQKCQECGKTFTNKSALAKHKLTHSTERKYSCHLCQKSFKRQDHLNGHMLTHQDKKPFQCKVPNCEKSYCDSRSLKRHIESQHQEFLAALANGNIDALSYLPRIGKLKANIGPNIHQTIVIENSNSRQSNEHTRFQDALNDCLNDKKEKEQMNNSQYSPITPINQPTLKKETIVNNATNTNSFAQKNYFTFEEPKPEICKICGKGFKNIPALNGHMRLHGGYIRPKVNSVQTNGDINVNKNSNPSEKEMKSTINTTNTLTSTVNTSIIPSNEYNNNNNNGYRSDLKINDNQLILGHQNGFQDFQENSYSRYNQPIQLPFTTYSNSSSLKQSNDDFLLIKSDQIDHKSKQKPKPKPLQIPSNISALHTYPNKTLLKSPHFNFDTKNQYTPPPMLSPFRRAPGLYFTAYSLANSAFSIPYFIATKQQQPPLLNTNIFPQIGNNSNSAFNSVLHTNQTKDEYMSIPKPSLLRSRMNSVNSTTVFFQEDIDTIKEFDEIPQNPHINLGPEFQAKIPKLEAKFEASRERTRENLMWSDNIMKKNSQVDLNNYLDITCKSSCVYGSSNNIELSLHILNYYDGNIQKSIKTMINGELELTNDHPIRTYSYQETNLWTKDEIKQFEEYIFKHDKNFIEISKELKTKTTKECVEFYYLWKKVMSDSTKKKWKSLKRKRKLEIDFDPEKLTQDKNNNNNINGNTNDLSEKENLCGDRSSSVSGTNNHISDDNDATSDTTISKFRDSENYSVDSSEESYPKSSINESISSKHARSQCSF